jgi:hypothetical protein
MYEEVIGSRSSIVLQEKTERGNKGKRGNDEVIERQENATFDELIDLYKTA